MCSVLFDKTILNAPRVALGIISGKIILNFGALKSLRTFQSTFFTRGVHEKEMAQQKPRSLVRRSGAFDLLTQTKKGKGKRRTIYLSRRAAGTMSEQPGCRRSGNSGETCGGLLHILQSGVVHLTSELSELFTKSHELEAQIKERLGAIGFEI